MLNLSFGITITLPLWACTFILFNIQSSPIIESQKPSSNGEFYMCLWKPLWKKGFVWQYQKFQASPIYTSKLYAMKGTYRGLRLNNFLQKTIKIPVIPVINAWTIVLWWKCESRLAWIWTSKSSSQQQSRCLHNLDCEFNQISEKNLKQDFQLYNSCCSYCAAMKYSNFNLDIQQENLRQGNQLMPPSCNEMLRIEIEYIAKGYQTGLSGKYVKGFEQTPLMFIFCPVEANEWDRKMGAEKTFLLGSYFLLFAMHWYFVFRTLLMFSICEQMLFFFIILQLLCTFLHSKC